MLTESEIEAALKLCEAATPHLKVWVECVPTKNECRIVGQTYCAYESAEIDANAINAARTLLPKVLEELKLNRALQAAHDAVTRVPEKSSLTPHDVFMFGYNIGELIDENERLRADLQILNYEQKDDEVRKLRAENERLRNEPHDVAETRKALAEGEVLLENIKLRAENEKLRMDAALKTGYVEAVVGYDELRRIIHNLRAENKELIGEIEDARVALSHLLSGEEITKLRAENAKLLRVKEAANLYLRTGSGDLEEALKALDEEGK